MTDEDGKAPTGALRRSSAWATTFIASLELAKQQDRDVCQESPFYPIF